MSLTPRERVLGAIHRTQVDRLPSEIWTSKYVKRDLMRREHTNEEGLLELLGNHFVIVCGLDNHWAWEKREPFDAAQKAGYIRLSEDGKMIYDNWGVGWDISSEGTLWAHHPLTDTASLDGYAFPEVTDDMFEFMKTDKGKYGERYCIAAMQDATLFERAYALRGLDTFLMDLKWNQAFAEALLEGITEYGVALAERYVEIGIDCVITGDDYGTQADLIMSPDDWERYMMPRLARIWGVYKDHHVPVVHHSCGNVMKIIPQMIDIGLDILHPVQHVMSPELLAREFGKDLVFFGGIDSQHLISFGKPEEIEAEVERIVSILGRDGGYIVAPDQNIMSSVPMANLFALIRAVKERSYRRRAGGETAT